MAAHERLFPKVPASFTQNLAAVLPKGVAFHIYHLSTPPTRTPSLYSAPPGARPDRTYCESHFLSASIEIPSKETASETVQVLVFAIEILIYSTAFDTTFFVSKADSTGYLRLLNLPNGTPSPLRDISATFLKHLLEQHQRPGLRSIVSLFARAQDQYLFPGSIEYSGKHVLDDRGLVRWWCRVLDPLIEDSVTLPGQTKWGQANGYLIVPGQDLHETRAYLPQRARTSSLWTIGHPLEKITRHSHGIPPRCLVPHYPDDPKARYLDELDDEMSKGQNDLSGRWKSVQTIDQFWDMMAFRQECSAGRMVGFIWLVFQPKMPEQEQADDHELHDTQVTMLGDSWDAGSSFTAIPPSSPTTAFLPSSQTQPANSPLKKEVNFALNTKARGRKVTKLRPKKLTGRIIPRQPRIKTENKSLKILEMPEISSYFVWHPEGRGQVIVEASDYNRITELLLRLDFANIELASSSSARWINEVRCNARSALSCDWGAVVTGTKVVELRQQPTTAGVNNLTMGLVRKKRKVEDTEGSVSVVPPAVNALEASKIQDAKV